MYACTTYTYTHHTYNHVHTWSHTDLQTYLEIGDFHHELVDDLGLHAPRVIATCLSLRGMKHARALSRCQHQHSVTHGKSEQGTIARPDLRNA